jgi:hypothetical protein
VIVAAGLLVLVGLGLFVAGVLTGVTALYWACVGVCVVAAVLLFLARRQLRTTAPAAPPATRPASAPGATSTGATSTGATSTGATSTGATSTGRHGGSADASGTVVPAATQGNGAVPPEQAAPAAPTTPATHADLGEPSRATAEAGEPPVEEVEVTDLLLVVDLRDEVLVVDEHPRYHVAGCRHLAGRDSIPLPVDEAKTDGFTPCGTCRPDATLADRVRAQRAEGN